MENKSCSNCKYSSNLRFDGDNVAWNCLLTPFQTDEAEGDYEYCFKVFYCSQYNSLLQ